MNAVAQKIEESSGELIIVDSSPAAISVNFEVVRDSLEHRLKKYDVIVTEDTVVDAKALATELNKNAADYDRLRKEAVEKVSGPIRLFETQMKTLTAMCKDGRTKLLNQISVFDQRVLDNAKLEMQNMLTAEWEAKQVEPEFRRATIDDLIKKGALTGKGNLTTATKANIRSRVQEDKSLQDQTNMRLVMLENQSYRAGLSAPLTRAHVESFLFEGETVYQYKLDAMMESEKQRQSVTETALRERISKEQPQAETVSEPEPEAIKEPEQAAQSNVVAMTPAREQQPEVPTADAIVQPSVEYAYGPLENISKASFAVTTRSEIEAKAISQFPEGNVGIWTKDGLITQILRDASVTQ